MAKTAIRKSHPDSSRLLQEVWKKLELLPGFVLIHPGLGQAQHTPRRAPRAGEKEITRAKRGHNPHLPEPEVKEEIDKFSDRSYIINQVRSKV